MAYFGMWNYAHAQRRFLSALASELWPVGHHVQWVGGALRPPNPLLAPPGSTGQVASPPAPLHDKRRTLAPRKLMLQSASQAHEDSVWHPLLFRRVNNHIAGVGNQRDRTEIIGVAPPQIPPTYPPRGPPPRQ
jgi:hypothetical protein